MRGALSIHDDRQPGRFRLSGPPVSLGAKAALSLALMLHELATNAAKYGALSVPEGRVALEWSLRDDASGPIVDLSWSEADGPPVVPPTRKGFGSRLIERGLTAELSGEARIAFEPGGVVCRIEAGLEG